MPENVARTNGEESFNSGHGGSFSFLPPIAPPSQSVIGASASGDVDEAPPPPLSLKLANAARLGDHETLAHVLQAEHMTRVDRHGRSLLHHAATCQYDGQRASLLLLLTEHGADPNATDVKGRTALHEAARSAHVEAAELLIEHGARTDALDHELCTPLTLAMRAKRGKGDRAMIRVLEAGSRQRVGA